MENAINSMKKGNAPDPDNITFDLLKDAGSIIHKNLTNLIRLFPKEYNILEDWNIVIKILQHKKGNEKYLTNYRSISLLSCIYKLVTMIITDIISKPLDDNQPRVQAGFKKSYSTIDHLQTLNQPIEKPSEYNMPSHSFLLITIKLLTQ